MRTERLVGTAGRRKNLTPSTRSAGIPVLLTALGLMSAVGLAGCGSDGDPGSPTTAATQPSEMPSEPPAETPDAQLEGPRLVTAEELAAVATDRGPVYWAGEREGQVIELTLGTSATFVRYLAPEAEVGADEPALTVATYRDIDGFGSLEGSESTVMAQSGAIIYAPADNPESVYFAFPGATFQVEVFSPVPDEAATLTDDGAVRPVEQGEG